MEFKRNYRTLISVIIVKRFTRGSKPKGMLITMRIVLALSLLFLVGLSCARNSAPWHTPVTPETVIPSRVLPTSAALTATATPPATAALPQSVVPTSPLPTPTAPSATATQDATPVVPTPTTAPATSSPDAASLITELTIGPLPVHQFTPLDSEVDGSWLPTILSLMPDSEYVREIIWMQNMLPVWKYYQLHGHSRPTVDDGPEGYSNYILALYESEIGVPYIPQVSRRDMPWISGITGYIVSGSTFSTMGFDPRNVDYAAAGGKQPIVLEAVVGRVRSGNHAGEFG